MLVKRIWKTHFKLSGTEAKFGDEFLSRWRNQRMPGVQRIISTKIIAPVK